MKIEAFNIFWIDIKIMNTDLKQWITSIIDQFYRL